jgi:hypothetical protein
MDIVVVTRAADAHLLRFFLASYECFWECSDKLILVTRRSDSYLWPDVRLPAGTRLIYREDFPELGPNDFRNQLYLKLISYQFVETEYYALMDSDFLFVAPCSEDAFFCHGKPVWFHGPWEEVALRWKAGSEAFVGESIDQLYMSVPQYVFSRRIAAELSRRYDPRRILEMEGVSEFIVYGWFARHFFPDAYHWVDAGAGRNRAIGRMVNQVPPSYCDLNPLITLDDFPDARFVAFWSHWDLAESKMADFLQEAHRHHTDRKLNLPDRRRIYPNLTLPLLPEKLYAEIRGVYSDGWVKDEVWFAVDGSSHGQLRLKFDVPAGPIAGCWQICPKEPSRFVLNTGLNELSIELNPGLRHPILLRFDNHPSAGTDSTDRSLLARLIGVDLDTLRS